MSELLKVSRYSCYIKKVKSKVKSSSRKVYDIFGILIFNNFCFIIFSSYKDIKLLN